MFVFDFCASWAILPLTRLQGGSGDRVVVVVGKAEMTSTLCCRLSENNESARHQF
jgi:hypothetical protein